MRENKDAITEHVLQYLGVGRIDKEVLHPKILYTLYKYHYFLGNTEEAIDELSELIETVDEKKYKNTQISCIHRLVKWRMSEITSDNIEDLIRLSNRALNICQSNRKSWHRMAILYYKCLDKNILSELMLDKSSPASNAIECLCSALNLSGKKRDDRTLQDILRLISLWFKYGNKPAVNSALESNLKKISIEIWLYVIPQLIARIYTKHKKILSHLKNLLNQIGEKYPQALLYPLSVCTSLNRDENKEGQNILDSVLNTIKIHHQQLYEESVLVSKELVRIAIIWSDMLMVEFEKGISAARDKNYDKMNEIFNNFFEKISVEAETQIEALFKKRYKEEMNNIRLLINKFNLTKDDKDYDELKKGIIIVTRKIKNNEHYSEFSLQQISPKLAKAENLELLIPLTFCEIKQHVYNNYYID